MAAGRAVERRPVSAERRDIAAIRAYIVIPFYPPFVSVHISHLKDRAVRPLNGLVLFGLRRFKLINEPYDKVTLIVFAFDGLKPAVSFAAAVLNAFGL